MSEATIVGAVAVEVIPAAKGFAAKLAAQVLPGSGALANALSKNFTQSLDKDVADALDRGLGKGSGKAKAQGTKAGAEYGGALAAAVSSTIKAANAALPALKITAKSTDATKTVTQVKALLATLGDKTVGVDVKDTVALAKLELIRRKLGRIIGDANAGINLRVTSKEGVDKIDALTAATRKASTATGNLASSIQGRLTAALNGLPDPRIDITLPRTLQTELKRIRQELTDLSGLRVDIDIPFDQLEARTKKLDADIRRLGSQTGSERAKSGLAAALKDITAINTEIQSARDEKFVIEPVVRPGFVVAEIKAALKAAQAAIGDGVTIPLRTEEGRAALTALLADVGLLHEHIGVDLDTTEAMTRTRALSTALHSVGDNISFSDAVRGEAKEAANALEQGLTRVDTTITPKVNDKPAVAQMGVFAAALKAIADKVNSERITPRFDNSDALAELDALALRAAGIANVDFTVKGNTKLTLAEVKKLESALKKLDHKRYTAEVRVNSRSLLADVQKAGTLLAATATDAAGGISRLGSSLLGASPQAVVANVAILGLGASLAALLPLAAPIAAAIPAALIGIGTAAGFAVLGVGALALVFGGLSKGLTALHQSQAAAAQTAASQLSQDQALATSKRAVATAIKGVATAHTNAAATIAAAMRSERDAGRALVRAQLDQKDALVTLSEAQRSQRQAQLKLTQARAEAKRTLEDLNDAVRTAALAQRSANQDVIDGRIAYNKVLADPTATEDDKQRALNSYQEQQNALIETTKTNKRAKEDQAKAAKTGIAGVDAVISAQEALRNSVVAVGTAQRGVTDAARATATAQENVALAAQATAKAQVDAAASVVTAQQGVIDAENALKVAIATPPAGTDWRKGRTKQEIAIIELLDQKLTPAWKRFKAKLSEPILSAIPGLLDDLLVLEPQLDGIAGTVGKSLGDFLGKVGDATKTKSFTDFLNWLKTDGGPILDDLGDIFLSIGQTVADTAVAFGPNTKDMVGGLKDMAKNFAAFMAKFLKSKKFQDFLDYVKANGPRFVQFLKDAAVFVGKLLIAFAPMGLIMLALIANITSFFAACDPIVLGAITVALLALLTVWLGFVTGAVAAALFWILLAAVVVGVVALLIYAYKRFTWFHDLVDAVWHGIAAGATWLWKNVLVPVFDGIVAVFKTAWKVIWAVFGWPLKLLWSALKLAIQIWWAAIRIIFAAVKIAFEKLGDGLVWVWDHAIKPLFDTIEKFWDAHLAKPFKKVVDTVLLIWDGLRSAFAKVIYFVLDVVVNKGLLAGFNWVGRTVLGKSHYTDIKFDIPDGIASAAGHAKGTVLPGYAPGRDIVPAWLSPGEGVLVPQAVRQLGAATVLDMNARALRGEKIRRYANGGLVPKIEKYERLSGVPFRVTSGYRAGANDWHGQGMAVDAASNANNMIRLARWLYQKPENLLELIHSGGPGFFVKNQKPVTAQFYRKVYDEHFDHVHVAMNQAGIDAGMAGKLAPADGSGPVDNDGGGWGFGKLAAKIRDMMKAGLAGLKGMVGDSVLGKALGGVPEKLISYMTDVPAKWAREAAAWAAKQVKKAGKWVVDLFTGEDTKKATTGHAAGVKATPGVAQAYALKMLPKMGWDIGEWSSLKPLWAGESSWRWNATGDATKLGHAYGIPQSLPGTKMTAAGDDWKTNAFTQINWGMDYIKERYGDPAMAYTKWQGRDPHWYDQGGYIPPGISLVRNDTGKPEPVLNDAQWQAMMAGRDSNGHLTVGVRVHDGAVAGLVSAHVDEQLGALADAHVYGN